MKTLLSLSQDEQKILGNQLGFFEQLINKSIDCTVGEVCNRYETSLLSFVSTNT